ncbi:uncharacterized protein LOC141695502 [Apium graveolens]|uniref:uncharacterized protein LOC141695502 n=1 Tax=Apium graveolens TaxID=4045 RepID=UPI003D7A5FCC
MKGHHAYECRNQMPDVICFRCRKIGHYVKNCKKQAPGTDVPTTAGPSSQMMLRSEEPSAPPKTGTSNITMPDAIQSSDMVAGTLLVNSVGANVLIESRATRSFIPQNFVDKSHYEVELLEQPLMIGIANKNQVSVNRVCPKCDIEIGRHHFMPT